MVVEAVAYDDKRPGHNSLPARVARLKRDHPDYAAKLLSGEFIKQNKTGAYSIDLNAAETAAYGGIRSSQLKLNAAKRAATPLNVAKLIRRALVAHTAEEIVAAINGAGMIDFQVTLK